MNEQIINQQQVEKVKLTRGATGKYGYEISLLGKPEDNLQRLKDLKDNFNKLIEFENQSNTKEVKN